MFQLSQRIHVYLMLVLVWELARTGVCIGEGRRNYQEVCADLISLKEGFWMHTTHHLDRDYHRGLAVWIMGASAIQWQHMYTQNQLDFARYKVDPKFSEKKKMFWEADGSFH